jgi:uncharacterized protein (TIGR02118 family)
VAQMVVIYNTPKAPAVFDKHYFEIHVPLAKKLAGLRKYEVSRGPVTTLTGGFGVHMIATLHFDDFAAIQNAFGSPEGRVCREDRMIFAPDEADFKMFLFDDREL